MFNAFHSSYLSVFLLLLILFPSDDVSTNLKRNFFQLLLMAPRIQQQLHLYFQENNFDILRFHEILKELKLLSFFKSVCKFNYWNDLSKKNNLLSNSFHEKDESSTFSKLHYKMIIQFYMSAFSQSNRSQSWLGILLYRGQKCGLFALERVYKKR